MRPPEKSGATGSLPGSDLAATPTQPVSPRPVPQREAEGSREDQLSQWALIRRAFARHKVAVASVHVLLVLYLVAAFGGFFAPYAASVKRLDYAYCPPMIPRFDFERGLHVLALRMQEDPISLRKYYLEDPTEVVPLGFFARSAEVSVLGLFTTSRRFIGVDEARWRASLSSAAAVREAPAFLLLGGDGYGQCVFSRLIHGARISLSIGLISIVFTFLFGVTIGGVSGYVGGKTDTFIQRIIEIVGAFPQLPLWLGIAAVLPGDWPPLRVYFAITIVLSLLNWTELARVVRGKILTLREEDYAVAARLLGASHGRVLFRHLLPGFTSHIIVTLTLAFPAMILGETALSFLGLGLRPPIVSWGVMLQDCLNLQVVVNYPWLLMPVVCIVIAVLAFNFLGDGLRDAADPYSTR